MNFDDLMKAGWSDAQARLAVKDSEIGSLKNRIFELGQVNDELLKQNSSLRKRLSERGKTSEASKVPGEMKIFRKWYPEIYTRQ